MQGIVVITKTPALTTTRNPALLLLRAQALVMLVLSGSLSSPSMTVAKDVKVVGCGGVGIDYLASVAQFPKPDEKLRTQALQVAHAYWKLRRLERCCRLQPLSPVFAASVSSDLFYTACSVRPLLQVQGGGNAGNAMTAAARLGLKPTLISKARAASPSESPPDSWPCHSF